MIERDYQPFDDSLLFGESAQDRVAEILRVAGGKADKKDGRAKYDFELIFHDHVFRVEVKCEDRKAHTGNICVEVMQGRDQRPSGVAWSEATVCVHTLAREAAVYRRREMYHHVREMYRKSGRSSLKSFGDNRNLGYILPIAKLCEFPEWFDYRPLSTLADSAIWLS